MFFCVLLIICAIFISLVILVEFIRCTGNFLFWRSNFSMREVMALIESRMRESSVMNLERDGLFDFIHSTDGNNRYSYRKDRYSLMGIRIDGVDSFSLFQSIVGTLMVANRYRKLQKESSESSRRIERDKLLKK